MDRQDEIGRDKYKLEDKDEMREITTNSLSASVSVGLCSTHSRRTRLYTLHAPDAIISSQPNTHSPKRDGDLTLRYPSKV